MRLFKNADYKFIEKRKTAYVFSAVLILAGIAAMVLNIGALGSWQNYGVDFEGGSLVQVKFTQPITAADVRSALGGVSAPETTQFGAATENEFVIRAPLEEGSTIEEVAQGIGSQLEASFGPGSFQVIRQELVGAKVGSELQTKAAWAIMGSLVLTLIYLAFRFEWRFGLAAVIATVHDLMVTLGALAIFRTEISLPTVAALLTILGYSLNDTIVVFDRIRENLNRKGGRKENFINLVNRSINETLPRTILTSGTTLAVLMALLILGGAVIRPFALVLILGVVVGTYSSVFVASPALIEIRERYGDGSEAEKRRQQRKKERAKAAAATA